LVMEETSEASRSCVRVWRDNERVETDQELRSVVPSKSLTVNVEPGSIDAEGDDEALRDSDRDPEELALELGLRLALSLRDWLNEGEMDADSLRDGERDSDALSLRDGLSDSL